MSLIFITLIAGCRSPEPDLTWQRIQEQGVLRVGMDPSWVPFEYVDGAGQLAGFDVELARELARRLGLEVEFVANLSFDGLYDGLTAGRVDAIISAAVVDLGRSADFAYSIPYFDAGQVLVVGPEGAAIDTMGDQSGRVLAVELGSAGDTIARRWARRLADVVLLHADSAGAALDVVAQGQADAALIDRATALMALKERAGPTTTDEGPAKLRINGEAVTGEQYAIVVRYESGALLRALDAALINMRRDDTLEELEKKWLGP